MQSNYDVQIGPYKLQKTLGIGSFGKVKLAVHEKTGHKVAVKILNRNKIHKGGMGEKVRREILNLMKLKHPHIIRLYEVISTPSDIFVVMEVVSSGELFEYIVKRGKLPEREARHLFQQLISAVEYCHWHGVVHRDLKPENLLLDEHGNIKVADFGLSNVMADGAFLHTSCGSPNYAAPEVISAQPYPGPEVDVWSCGVILYALLCGSLPFDDGSIHNLFRKIKHGDFTIPGQVSDQARDLITRMLVVDPLRRLTCADIKRHAWVGTALPRYLHLTPAQLDAEGSGQEVDMVACATAATLGYPGAATPEAVAAHVAEGGWAPVAVAYELVAASRQAAAVTAATAAGGGGSIGSATLGLTLSSSRATKMTPFSVSLAGATASAVACGAGGGMGLKVPQLLVAASRRYAFMPSTWHARHAQAVSTAEKLLQVAFQEATVAGRGGIAGFPSTAPAEDEATTGPRRRRWFLGIQSKREPAHVMREVYRALRDAEFQWKVLTPYHIRVRWRPSHATVSALVTLPVPHAPPDAMAAAGTPPLPLATRESVSLAARVKVDIRLYRVQSGVYLMDLARHAGDIFSFTSVCARVITELKTPSRSRSGGAAASRAGHR